MTEQRSFVAGRFNGDSADIFIDGQLTLGSPRLVPVIVLDIRTHSGRVVIGQFSLSVSETRVLAREPMTTADALEAALGS